MSQSGFFFFIKSRMWIRVTLIRTCSTDFPSLSLSVAQFHKMEYVLNGVSLWLAVFSHRFDSHDLSLSLSFSLSLSLSISEPFYYVLLWMSLSSSFNLDSLSHIFYHFAFLISFVIYFFFSLYHTLP